MLAAVAGCGNGARPTAAQSTAATQQPGERLVNVYNWEDYIAPDTVAKFERATGIKVQYDVFDGNEVLETKLLTGHTGYDVVVPSAYFLERMARQGVFQPLDRSQLSNYGELDPKIMAMLAVNDPGNRYAVPYMWLTIGFAYNVAAIREALGDVAIDSWAFIFDPQYAARLKHCGLVMLDAPTDVLDAVRLYLGIDPNSEDLAELERTAAALRRVRPYVYNFRSLYTSELANGEICMVLGYSGDLLQARDLARQAGKGVDIRYVIPKEGATLAIDTLAIPADAPHPDTAHAFINFILRPEIAAEISDFRRYANANAGALKLVDPELRADPGIYPPPEILARLHPRRAESLEFARREHRAWVRIRSDR